MLYDYGPATVDIRLVRGNDFSMVVDVEGDRDADTFTAYLRPVASATTTAISCSAGAYNAGAGTTPVTLTIADTVTDLLTPGDHVWDLKWTAAGVERTIAGGAVEVIANVTP